MLNVAKLIGRDIVKEWKKRDPFLMDLAGFLKFHEKNFDEFERRRAWGYVMCTECGHSVPLFDDSPEVSCRHCSKRIKDSQIPQAF